MIRPNDNNQHPRATTPSHLDRWLRRREYPKRQSSFGATRSDPLARIYPPISIAKDCFFFFLTAPETEKGIRALGGTQTKTVAVSPLGSHVKLLLLLSQFYLPPS